MAGSVWFAALRRLTSICNAPDFQSGFTYIVLDSHNRCRQEFHRVHDAADVVGATGTDGIGLAATGRRAQRDAIQFFMRGIQDPHGQPIGRAGFERSGNVEFKRVFRPLVSTYAARRSARPPPGNPQPEKRRIKRPSTCGLGGVTKSRQYQATPW